MCNEKHPSQTILPTRKLGARIPFFSPPPECTRFAFTVHVVGGLKYHHGVRGKVS